MVPKVEQFVQLLTAHQMGVYGFILSLVGNRVDADEILQETNLVLWRKFDEFSQETEDTSGDFRAWAWQVAYHEIRKFQRKRRRNPFFFSDDFLEDVAMAALEQSDVIEARQRALDGCLAKLNDRDRKLILLRYQPESTARSVASAVGRSVHAVYKAVARIRSALAKCIERTLASENRL